MSDLPPTSLEAYLAGYLSTLPEFAARHPADLIPMAADILQVCSEWDPAE